MIKLSAGNYLYQGWEISKTEEGDGWLLYPPNETIASDKEDTLREAKVLIDRYLNN